MTRIPRLCAGLAAVLLLAAGCGLNDPDVLYERGVRACEAGRYSAAARSLRRAATLEPAHAAAQLWCGVAYWKTGEHEEALPFFMAAAQLDTANPVPLEYAALIHAERGEWLEVGKRLNEAFRRMPDSPRVLNAMGVASAMRGNPAASHAQLQQAIRIAPDYAPALYNAAVLYRDALHQPAEAHRLFNRYLQLAPLGDKADAARLAVETLNLPTSSAPAARPGHPPRAGLRTQALMNQAQAALKRQDVDEAAVRLREAVDEDAGSPEALWSLARLYDGQAAQPDRALDAYRSFARDFPEDPRATEARSRINDLTGRRTPVVSPSAPPPGTLADNDLAFKKPEVRNPAEAMVFVRRGIQYYGKRDYDRAQFDFRRAIELDDTLPEPVYHLGLVYWCRGDFEHARQLFQNALAKRPNWPDARCMLARVYLRQRLGIKAVEHLNEILKTDPTYADAYYELGSYYREAPSHRQQVKGWYDRYLQLAPQGAYAPQAKAWLAANP